MCIRDSPHSDPIYAAQALLEKDDLLFDGELIVEYAHTLSLIWATYRMDGKCPLVVCFI